MKFLNCDIEVPKGIFLPRVETEHWVGEALEEIEDDLRVLDLFCGSGCIGVSVLKKFGSTKVDFVDVSYGALTATQRNLFLNRIRGDRYNLWKSDLFSFLEGRRYDVIFANPPYVALDRKSEVSPDTLNNDPEIALFSGADGLDCIRRLIAEAKEHLSPSGVLYIEFDPQQKEEIEGLVLKEGLLPTFGKDQFDAWRWVKLNLD